GAVLVPGRLAEDRPRALPVLGPGRRTRRPPPGLDQSAGPSRAAFAPGPEVHRSARLPALPHRLLLTQRRLQDRRRRDRRSITLDRRMAVAAEQPATLPA